MSDAIRSMTLTIGLVAIGAAMAWAVALAMVQDAAITAGVFPQPGERIAVGAFKTSPFWKTATTLQTLANVSAVLGAVSLLIFGYQHRGVSSE